MSPRAALWLLLVGSVAEGQELGHKLLGTLGLDAGTQQETGVYLAERLLFYRASDLRDGAGDPLPVSLDFNAVANGVGIFAVYKLPRLATYVSSSISVPIAWASARITNPETGVRAGTDRFGLADVYVQPLRLGWRPSHLDIVTGYAFYVPTRRFEPGGGGSGVSRAQWTQEFSLGGTLYLDRDRSWQISALTSYELNHHKLGIDITRGDIVQIQGGAGTTIARLVQVGVVGYGLWQVRDDRGSDVPLELRGLRSRTYGLGMEAGVKISRLRTKLSLRYAHDLAAVARTQGQVAVFSATYVAWPTRR